MALDGIFLGLLSKEIESLSKGAKVNQVQQPSRDELILQLHTLEGNRKLLICARADSPRVGFTSYGAENPKEPPMFCMFLRKHLCGARIKAVRQHESERIIFIDFDAINSVGDKRELTFAVEIMGKLSVINTAAEKIAERIFSGEAKTLDKAILNTVMGVSPVVCREIAFRACGTEDIPVTLLSDKHRESLKVELEKLREIAGHNKGTPTLIKNQEGKPFDLTFLDVRQYGDSLEKVRFNSYCELLDEYYHSRDTIERMRAYSSDLTRLTTNSIARITRKINAQTAELEETKNREELRIKGDLLQANLYRIERGASFAEVENFYDEKNSLLRIALNPAKTPAQNAQKFYKDYARAKTADKILRVQIEKGREELLYLESVLDEIERAATSKDMQLIRRELTDLGYIKAAKGKQKEPSELPVKEYKTSDGFTVFIGRNNRQNDKLTLKLSAKDDVWLHTKEIPGSHTVIKAEGKKVSDRAILEAAQFCAFNSKARESAQVPVDFTLIKYVQKPVGSPPGRVIYTHQKTVYVTPVNPEK